MQNNMLRNLCLSFESQADSLELLSKRTADPIERAALFDASLKAREAAHKLAQGAEELEIAEAPLFRHHLAPRMDLRLVFIRPTAAGRKFIAKVSA